jgi:hypothetical protein
MPRRPEPEGRRNSVCTKLSDSELAEVEAARGDMDLSAWVRFTLLIAADAVRQAETARQRFAAAQEQSQPASRRHAVTCKCGMCRPKNGEK